MNYLASISKILSASVLGSLVIGCGSPQATTPPLGVDVQNRGHRASGSYEDLVYVSTTKKIVMVSYPDGEIVGTIPWSAQSLDGSICSDPTNGNVFIPEGTSPSNSVIYEYAHGDTTPIATLNLPSGDLNPNGCAVDPVTGNLAVIAWTPPSNQNAFLVYPHGQGTPTTYSDKKANGLFYAAYDDSGNLFSMTGAPHVLIKIAELRRGKSTFTFLKFMSCSGCEWAKLQWDGKYLAFPYFPGSQRSIGELDVSRRNATLVNSVVLDGLSNRTDGFWIYNGSVIGEYQKLRKRNDEAVAVWPYPSGGSPTAKFYGMTRPNGDTIEDITVSVAPNR